MKTSLNNFYISGRRALLALLNLETHPITFMKRLKTGPADTCMMYEYVSTAFLLYKAIPLAFIKPFNDSICHNGTLLSYEDCYCFNL